MSHELYSVPANGYKHLHIFFIFYIYNTCACMCVSIKRRGHTHCHWQACESCGCWLTCVKLRLLLLLLCARFVDAIVAVCVCVRDCADARACVCKLAVVIGYRAVPFTIRLMSELVQISSKIAAHSFTGYEIKRRWLQPTAPAAAVCYNRGRTSVRLQNSWCTVRTVSDGRT